MEAKAGNKAGNIPITPKPNNHKIVRVIPPSKAPKLPYLNLIDQGSGKFFICLLSSSISSAGLPGGTFTPSLLVKCHRSISLLIGSFLKSFSKLDFNFSSMRRR